MQTTFHETYTGAELKPPPERSTGLVFAGVAVIIAVLSRGRPTAPWVALGVALVLTAVSLIAPTLLTPLNVFWFRLGLLLQKVVNPIVMFAVFAVVFVPAGVVMRLWWDPLRLRQSARRASTHWIERKNDGTIPSSMSNQF